jgi:hypothetical protein
LIIIIIIRIRIKKHFKQRYEAEPGAKLIQKQLLLRKQTTVVGRAKRESAMAKATAPQWQTRGFQLKK